MRQRLLALTTVATLQSGGLAQWENRDFNIPKPVAGLWLREQMLPINERQIGNLMLQLDSYMRYDVFSPFGKGTETADQLAKQVADQFKACTSLVGSGTTAGVDITIVRSEILNGRQGQTDDPWWMIPVQITFAAFAPL